MTILITTIVNNTNILYDLISITNYYDLCPLDKIKLFYDFNKNNHLKKIDECWIISLDKNYDKNLRKIADSFGIKIKTFKCKGIEKILSQKDYEYIHSLVFRVILNAKNNSDCVYFAINQNSMTFGLQEGAQIFGCDAMYTISEQGLPLLLKGEIPPSITISSDDGSINSKDYPLNTQNTENPVVSIRVENDKSLLKIAEDRRMQSIYLSGNFYGMVKSTGKERGIFRKLYYLPQSVLNKLRNYKLGKNKETDLWIIQHLPKAELHSHLGGLLLPEEIIDVALKAKNYKVDYGNEAGAKFYERIRSILNYQNKPKDFEAEIYKDVQNHFKGIGINKYQSLGDYQGSSLLLLKETLEATIDIYAEHLLKENIKYVEIRCSPYNYTKLGMSIDAVVMSIINTLNKYSNCFDYKLIYIISRQSSDERIEDAVNEYCRLYDTNLSFKEKFVGVDVAGDEEYRRPSELRNHFMSLFERCAHVTIHAGETDTVDSIWEAVYHLNADRIGHGLKLLDNQELYKRFVDKKIGIEMCPSSNNQIIGYAKGEYPLLSYMREGLRVTLNTDDCGISLTNLTNEFLKAAEMCPGLTLWDCVVLVRNSLCIAFCDENTREKLMHSFEDEILELFVDIFGD